MCIDETKYSLEAVGMLLQPQRGIQSCLSCTNVVLVWLFKTSGRVSRNVMCKVAIRGLKQEKKRRKVEKEVGGMTEEQKNEGPRKSRRSIRGMQRTAPFILLFALLPHKVVRAFFFQKVSGVPQAHPPFSYA